MNAADSNVYIYAFDADEPLKKGVAESLFDGWAPRRSGSVLLWQVADEVLNVLRKWEMKGKVSSEDARRTFQIVRSMFPLLLPTGAIFSKSFDLRSKFSLSHWDSMLLAAAKEAGITTLYSEDMTDGCDDDGVVVVNPLRGC